MKERFNCIVEYLNKKESEHFTGSTKLSFESGNCVAINEANKHDLPTTDVEESFCVISLLQQTKNPIFNGAIVLNYDNGKVTQYAYSKSFKGETLKKILGA